MLELPEVLTMYKDLNNTIIEKEVTNAIANKNPHKFAFYIGNPKDYSKLLKGEKVISINQLRILCNNKF